jgi:hypothetical protein
VLLKLLADEKQKSLHEKWHSQAALICTNEHRSGSIKYSSALGAPDARLVL